MQNYRNQPPKKLTLQDCFANKGDKVIVVGTSVTTGIVEATTYFSKNSKYRAELQYGAMIENPVVYSEVLVQQPNNPNIPTLKDFIESQFHHHNNQIRYTIRNKKYQSTDNKPYVLDRKTMDFVALQGELEAGQQIALILSLYYSKNFDRLAVAFDGVLIQDINEVRCIVGTNQNSGFNLSDFGELPTLDNKPLQNHTVQRGVARHEYQKNYASNQENETYYQQSRFPAQAQNAPQNRSWQNHQESQAYYRQSEQNRPTYQTSSNRGWQNIQKGQTPYQQNQVNQQNHQQQSYQDPYADPSIPTKTPFDD